MTSIEESNKAVVLELAALGKHLGRLGVRSGSVLLASGAAGPLGMLAVPILEDIADSMVRGNREEARARYTAAESIAERLKESKRQYTPEKLKSVLQQVTRHAVARPIDEKIRLVAAAALHAESGDVATIEEMELADWVAEQPLSVLRSLEEIAREAMGEESSTLHTALPEEGKRGLCRIPLGNTFAERWMKRFPHLAHDHALFMTGERPSRFFIRSTYWMANDGTIYKKQVPTASEQGHWWPSFFFWRLHRMFVVERQIIAYQSKLDAEAKEQDSDRENKLHG